MLKLSINKVTLPFLIGHVMQHGEDQVQIWIHGYGWSANIS